MAKPRKYRDQIDEYEDRGRRNKKVSLAEVESEEYFNREPEDDVLPAVEQKKRGRPRKVERSKQTNYGKRATTDKTPSDSKRAAIGKENRPFKRVKKAKESTSNKRATTTEKTIKHQRAKSEEKPIYHNRATIDKKPIASKQHAKFGSPSTLSRTEKCPAWIAFGKDIPEQEEGEHAIEGTTFHDFMEQCLPPYLAGDHKKVALILKGCTEYEDMETYVWDTLAKVDNLWKRFREKHAKCRCQVELEVKINDDCFGTSDVVFDGINIKTQKTSILTIDYKYGMGVHVAAKENLQGIAYLVGAAKTLNISYDKIGVGMVMIAQMRVNPDWENENFIVKGEEFQKREDEILKIVAHAKKLYEGVGIADPAHIQDNLHAGDHCRFCKCQAVCPTRKASTLDQLTSTATELLVTEDLPLEDQVKRLTLQEQINIFLKKSHIEDFLKAVASNLHHAFESGVTAPELKLIRTNGRRKWSEEHDPEHIAEALEQLGVIDPWQKKLKGLTEIEREIGKGKIDELVEQGEGKIELVLASDKRQAIQIAQAEELPA